MIEKVLVFFSTFNITVGLIITILSIFSVDIIRSCANDVIITICHSTIDDMTFTINKTKIKIGLFLSALIRLLLAIIVIFIIIHLHPFSDTKL